MNTQQLIDITKEVLGKVLKPGKRGGARKPRSRICPICEVTFSKDAFVTHIDSNHEQTLYNKVGRNADALEKLRRKIKANFSLSKDPDLGENPERLAQVLAEMVAEVGNEMGIPEAPEMAPEVRAVIPKDRKGVVFTKKLFVSIEGSPRDKYKKRFKEFFSEMGVTDFKQLPGPFLSEFKEMSTKNSVKSNAFLEGLEPFFSKWRQELSRVAAKEKEKFTDVPLKARPASKAKKPRVKKIEAAAPIAVPKLKKSKKPKVVKVKQPKGRAVFGGVDLIVS